MPFVIRDKRTGQYRKDIKRFEFTDKLERARIFLRKVDAINSLQIIYGRNDPKPTFELGPLNPITTVAAWDYQDQVDLYDIVEVKRTIELV